MKKLIILSLAACLMAGCGIYKPYSRPEVETDGLYRDIPTEDTVTLASLSWRELFTDPQLQTLIETGLEQNTYLRIARLRVEEAEAVLRNARLSYLPSVSLTPEGASAAMTALRRKPTISEHRQAGKSTSSAR